MLYLPFEFDYIMKIYSKIKLQLSTIFCITNLSSLKRNSTQIRKRHSFMLETKPITIKKPKKELPGVSSKRLDAHVKLFERCDFFCFYLCRHSKAIH